MITIGELVNGTRKTVRKAIEDRDAVFIKSVIERQDEAGADYIDLNAGTGTGGPLQEKEDMCWLIDCALECSEKKLTLDSADPEVLKAAAAHLDGGRSWMLNSIKGDINSATAANLALAAREGVPVIALAMDKEGIPRDAQKRIDICRLIAEKAGKAGLEEGALFFDPIVMPISADITQGKITLQTLEGIREYLPQAKTAVGLSNVSHGFQKRGIINAAFLNMAIGYGLDSAICDVTDPLIRKTILLAEMLSGKDRHCRRFTRALRQGAFK